MTKDELLVGGVFASGMAIGWGLSLIRPHIIRRAPRRMLVLVDGSSLKRSQLIPFLNRILLSEMFSHSRDKSGYVSSSFNSRIISHKSTRKMRFECFSCLLMPKDPVVKITPILEKFKFLGFRSHKAILTFHSKKAHEFVISALDEVRRMGPWPFSRLRISNFSIVYFTHFFVDDDIENWARYARDAGIHLEIHTYKVDVEKFKSSQFLANTTFVDDCSELIDPNKFLFSRSSIEQNSARYLKKPRASS